jgi:hypothetical protein
MSEIKTNKKTGLEFLLIGKQKFDADNEGIFEMELEDVKKILINELPLNRKCLISNIPKLSQLTSPIISSSTDEIDLIFVRRKQDLVEIIIGEEVYPKEWEIEITTEYFYTLKESVFINDKSLNPKIIKHDCFSDGQVSFEFSIELTATTIGEAFGKAVKINNSIEGDIMNAVEKGMNCIQSVLEGAFQTNVSHIFSCKDDNSKV